jgi:hypothetical protein
MDNIVILSRMKTNGSYILPPRYDPTFTAYSNRIECEHMETISKALVWIQKNGDKSRIYYICQPIQPAYQIVPANDVSNGFWAHSRYSFTDGSWTRICMSNSKSHAYSRRNGYGYY